jgi:hypothetical protein
MALFTREQLNSIAVSAARIGMKPEDLAGIINYETAGSNSPGKWGGKNGNYMGLIQFGGPERKQYGANPSQSFDEQLGAVERYYKDRGFKPGMGLLDAYSTVNAGTPGRYQASDRPGATVASHTAQITELPAYAQAQAYYSKNQEPFNQQYPAPGNDFRAPPQTLPETMTAGAPGAGLSAPGAPQVMPAGGGADPRQAMYDQMQQAVRRGESLIGPSRGVIGKSLDQFGHPVSMSDYMRSFQTTPKILTAPATAMKSGFAGLKSLIPGK